jgi:DNA repair protein RadC
MLCESEAQRSKLITLFEFKSLYETIRGAEDNHKYTMNSTEKAGEYLKNCFADSPDKEKFVAVFLDAKYGVLATKNMSVGTATHANIYVRELAKEALFHNAISVIISHNHLSGVMAPSREDKAATEKIKATLGAVGVELADHIIVAGNDYYSFADMGLMELDSPKKDENSLQSFNEKPDGFHNKTTSIRKQIAMIKENRKITEPEIATTRDRGASYVNTPG